LNFEDDREQKLGVDLRHADLRCEDDRHQPQSALPRKRTCALQLGMSAMCQ
jgi:hypothetical protein